MMKKRIELKVIARAKKEGIEKTGEDSYKIKVTTAPEKGKANAKIIELLAEEFGIRKQNITIISGLASNRKVVELTYPPIC